METALRPLGIVKELIEELGHEITYAYDDLIFVNHNDFLLQFSDEAGKLDLFFNTECPKEESVAISALLVTGALTKGLEITSKGTYSMTEQPDDTLQITFFPET